ncbi:NAD(P)-binding protein [Dendrothele bispora CBS 962.96]|uniref:NAD(P)-binding protein n=1 Tax=Dendrothele bispora (strain CBS 962.96) TaxID=1314807 RepID=A0A4V4HHQ5_DENBC|nr:NAD(P)-binding protein [Dendrothele bispora CBS 962.96]
MGQAPSKSFDPLRDLPDIKGKVVLVTGSSSGIGFDTLRYLVKLGAKVYMAARSEERAKSAIERLEKEGKEPGNCGVLWHELDLVDPRKAKASAEKFMEKEERLDILINNAAMFVEFTLPHLNFLNDSFQYK